MANYLVNVYTYHPYKIEYTYRQVAGSFGPAINRSIMAFRKEENLKGKRFREVYASARMM